MTNAPDYFTIILRLFYDGAFVAAEVPAPSPEQIVERTLLHRASHRLPILRGLLPGPPHRTPPRCTPLVNHGGERAVVAGRPRRAPSACTFPSPSLDMARTNRPNPTPFSRESLWRMKSAHASPASVLRNASNASNAASISRRARSSSPDASSPAPDASTSVRSELLARHLVATDPCSSAASSEGDTACALHRDVVQVLLMNLYCRRLPPRGSALVRNLVQKRRQPPLLDHDAVPHGEHAVYPVGRGQERAPAALQGRHPERGQFRGRRNVIRAGSGGASRNVKLGAGSQRRPRRIVRHLASVGEVVRRGVEQIQRRLLHRLVHHAVLRDPRNPPEPRTRRACTDAGGTQQLAPVGRRKG